VVKFSCPWGQFGDGKVYFLPAGKRTWTEPAVQKAKLVGTELVLTFETPGASKAVKNTARLRIF
jgi:hypothetical protein